ncbi:hypothetical protein ACP4OV_000326 [Aristida adscensionis]
MEPPPETFPVEEATEAINFLLEVNARFAENPAVRDEFYALVTDFGKGVITDARAVVARADELLHGHPELAARFRCFVDPEQEARQFLEEVKRTDKEMFDSVLATLLHVDEEKGLDAHAVYELSKPAFAAHGDLLRRFAGFLPSEYVAPPPCATAEREQQQRSARKRKPVATYYDGADAAESGEARKPKKLRVGDGFAPKPNPISYDDAGEAGSSKANKGKKPRVVDDGPAPKQDGDPASHVDAGVAGSSRPRRDRKPRADDGKNQRAPLAAAAAVVHDGTDEVRRFRKAWEFETGYSKLVATMARAEELRRSRAHGGSGRGGRRGGSRAVEELFPSRECGEYLAEMYGNDAWGFIRTLLEDGDCTDVALKTIVKSLREKEAAAVDEARRLRDPTRAGWILDELVRGRVRDERQKRAAEGQGASVTEQRRSPANRMHRRQGGSRNSSGT